MAQYIEKDRVEEILRCLWKQDDGSNPEHRICYNKALQEVQCKLDTIEVKEVDLVEEIDYKDYIRFFKEHPEYSDGSWGFEETWTFAQYCYKLGLNARKGK